MTVSLHDNPSITAMTSDGQYLYIHNKYGLFKIGSGYGGTVMVSYIVGTGSCLKVA